MSKRVLIIGAGPIGIAAALGATERGHSVTVLEKGSVGESLRQWGSTRFFSPLGMNIPPSFRSILDGSLPPEDALLTGPELAALLETLAEKPPLQGKIFRDHRVVAIGRRGLGKMNFAGHPLRSERPFCVIADTPSGERSFEADVVLDASGGFAIPTAFGAGGLPPLGDRSVREAAIRDLGHLDRELASLMNKHVLLIGHGHSAANAILLLERALVRVTWAVRSGNRRPVVDVANDPLPERSAIVTRANDLAEDPPEFLTLLRRTNVEAVESDGEQVRVTFNGDRVEKYDRIVALTGYRPDNSFLSELNVELSPVTEGTARLHCAVSKVTDCLTSPKVRLQDLESGEPGFYLIGSKSYGRSKTFLLRHGLQQLEAILASL